MLFEDLWANIKASTGTGSVVGRSTGTSEGTYARSKTSTSTTHIVCACAHALLSKTPGTVTATKQHEAKCKRKRKCRSTHKDCHLNGHWDKQKHQQYGYALELRYRLGNYALCLFSLESSLFYGKCSLHVLGRQFFFFQPFSCANS